jgi:hypothetical protein
MDVWIFIGLGHMELDLISFKIYMFCHNEAIVTSKHYAIAMYFTDSQNYPLYISHKV